MTKLVQIAITATSLSPVQKVITVEYRSRKLGKNGTIEWSPTKAVLNLLNQFHAWNTLTEFI